MTPKNRMYFFCARLHLGMDVCFSTFPNTTCCLHILVCFFFLNTVVVHGYKQLMMHQEVEDGQPLLQVCGRVALIRSSRPSEQCKTRAAAVKEQMKQNGFVVTEKTLTRDLDVSDSRYLIFVVNTPSAELEEYVRNLQAGALAGKSFRLISGTEALEPTDSEESMKQMLVGAGAEPLASTDFGPKGLRGVPDCVVVEDVFRAGADGNAYAASPYAVDQNKCREYLVYDTRAILPLFAVAYHRYNTPADRDDSDVATLENLIFPYLPPSRP